MKLIDDSDKYFGFSTGQELDDETQFDFFQARYLSAAQQRFLSPDPGNAGADLTNPQSWNAYSYVLNNPLSNVDPTGKDVEHFGNCFFNYYLDPEDGSKHYGSTVCLVPGDGTGGGDQQTTPPLPVKFTVTVTATPPNNSVCNNLPAGSSPEFCAALRQGLQNALNALRRNRCGNFYGGQGPQTLDATQYRFLDMQNPTTGAATITPNNVFINSQGPYMTYTPTPGQTGPFGRYWTQGQFRGFILLHELGHQLSPITGFRPDAGSPLNQQQSRQVLNACF